jgi:branched-chain amino acid transport system ATP-binding protein
MTRRTPTDEQAHPVEQRSVEPMLKVDEVTLRFGGVNALNEISLSVKPGALQAIIGPNGAGKTSLFNCLTGYYVPSSGTIFYNGTKLRGLSPPFVAALGIRRTFQNIRIFPRMSVLENVLAGGHLRAAASLPEILLGTPRFRRSERSLRDEADHWLEFVGLGEHRRRAAGGLAYGQRKRMEIARAMMGKPGLLLLDEPAAGVSSVEREALSGLISRVHSSGVGVVMIEHDVELVMSLATDVCVLDQGRLLASGPPAVVRADPEVIRAYMGRRRR